MKKLMLATLVVVAVSAVAKEDYKKQHILQRSVGRLVVLYDRLYSDQIEGVTNERAFLFNELIDVYEKRVASLPTELRVDFFWTVMWRLELRDTYKERFYQVVADDCGPRFISRLRTYLRNWDSTYNADNRFHEAENALLKVKWLVENNGESLHSGMGSQSFRGPAEDLDTERLVD